MSQITAFAQQTWDTQNQLFSDFYTSWVTNAPTPLLGGQLASWMSYVTAPLSILFVVIGLIIAGVRTMLASRGAPVAIAAKRFGTVMLVTAAGTTAVSILVAASDALAKWILETANAKAAPTMLGSYTEFASNTSFILLFGLLGLIAVGIQWLIVIFRSVALTVLVPFWPVSAAGAMLDNGAAGFEKITAWIFAFILYSPIAALLYGASTVLRNGQSGVQGVIYGMVIFILAIFALPALVRLVAPVANAVGRASAGGIMAAGARFVVTAGVAVGAVVATAGAAAPAAAGAAGGAAGGGAAAAGAGGAGAGAGAAATTSGAATTGGAGAATASESVGAAGAGSAASSSGGSSAASGSGGSWREAARDLTGLLPQGGNNGVKDMVDDD